MSSDTETARTDAAGTEATSVADTPQGHGAPREGGDTHTHGSSYELAISLTALAAYLVARVLDWTTTDLPIVIVLYVLTAAVTGTLVARDVLTSLRERRFDIEALMLLAAIGAAAIGHWSDAALLLVLFSVGHGLEHFATGRARSAIAALAELSPTTARRRNADGELEEVSVELLAVGDIVVVRPDERVAADGIVIRGNSSVDEAPVTGESVPVEKSPLAEPLGSRGALPDLARIPPAHRVFAGTLNGSGLLEISVARPAQDSTLARVAAMVADAEEQVSPTQVVTDRIVAVFVPAVLVLVAGLLFVPLLLGDAAEPTFMRAMAVLVAASPCALAIATPSAVLAGIARAARGGVLVKGGAPLEQLGRIDTIAFDKTGTLTEGRPKVVAVVVADGSTEDDLLATAVAVEQLSTHPLADAVVSHGRERGGLAELTATEVRSVPGAGVTAVVDGDTVEIGNAVLFGVSLPDTLDRARIDYEQAGATTMVLRRGGEFLGLIAVMDRPRPDAASTIDALRDLGIDRTVVLSGDQPGVVDQVAAELGITDAHGGLLPADKVEAIRTLAGVSRNGVAMVGDGVNDAPAMATATVGIAMGAAGSDVALETADIALMADRLDRLPFAVDLARRSSRVIRQNLFFSLAVVAVLIPLTIAGVGIGPAVIAHEGSTLVVVANALALLGRKERPIAANSAAGQTRS